MKRKHMMRAAEDGGQARVLAIVLARMAYPVIALLLMLGSIVMLPIQHMARIQAMGTVLNIGYSPASMNTSNLPQSQIIHYDKNFVKNLKANTPFLRGCARRTLPSNSGNQHRLYMYNALGANIAQTAEGTVGSGIVVTVVNNTSTIGQYADYVNMSDLSMETALDPALENIQKELAYRLGLTLSTLVRNTADGASIVDASVNALSLNYNVPFSRSVINSAVSSLTGRNVKPFGEGRMAGFIHSFIVGDALNDTSNNSLVDCLKRSAEGMEKLMELPSPDGDMVPVLEWAGVSFHQTSMVTQTTNYQGQGGTALRTYIVGEDGLIAISLGNTSGSQVADGDYRNLKLWMQKFDNPSISDPSRMIGGLTSYNVKFTVTLPPDTTQRIRIIDAQSQIS